MGGDTGGNESAELITKPFAYADLAARVRDMLDQSCGEFLEAHRGRPLTLTIATVSTYIPEAGRVTARLWWRGLTPAQRRAARRRFEAAIWRDGRRADASYALSSATDG